MKPVFAIILISLVGCTMEGKVSEKNVVMDCTDLRDGEKFSFNSNDIFDVRIGIGSNSYFSVIDLSGQQRELSAQSEAWIKCKRRQSDGTR